MNQDLANFADYSTLQPAELAHGFWGKQPWDGSIAEDGASGAMPHLHACTDAATEKELVGLGSSWKRIWWQESSAKHPCKGKSASGQAFRTTLVTPETGGAAECLLDAVPALMYSKNFRVLYS